MAHELAHAKLGHGFSSDLKDIVEDEEDAWRLTQEFLERGGEWTPTTANLKNRILRAWRQKLEGIEG